jgi:hypothetical protein
MSQPDFTLVVDQNEYLPDGGQDVSAIITVTSADTGPAAPAEDMGAAEIIMVDCSGSMSSPPTKIAQARTATSAAVDVIRDGVAFAVIAGTQSARPVFPRDGRLAVADAQTREAAKHAVAGLEVGDGTAIGQWLRLAHHMFTSDPAALRHRTSTRRPSSWTRRSAGAKACSAVTAGVSARTGKSASSAGSPRPCSAPSTSCPTRPTWPPTSPP